MLYPISVFVLTSPLQSLCCYRLAYFVGPHGATSYVSGHMFRCGLFVLYISLSLILYFVVLIWAYLLQYTDIDMFE